MNAKCFPEPRREARADLADRAAEADAAEDEVHSAFWPWFALGVLLFCWIAEASMCAERGF
jgi:hypothetical protein